MSTGAARWEIPRPARGALANARAGDASVWADRLRADRERATRNQTRELLAITATVEKRCHALEAAALILSGSTARGRRTDVSDLDYHVIGARPRVTDLPAEIDLYSDDVVGFARKLHAGDDFVHWSVWYGCVLFDSGVVRTAASDVGAHDLWPSAERKLGQARRALDFAARMVDSGDDDAALEQVREALSLIARWWLLAQDVFPLARDELSGQLSALGQPTLARGLHRSIHERLSLSELRAALASGRSLTERAVAAVR
jgi:predicted nucleotidyltransferase